MLTPIDQPLDKLEGLSKSEMYVHKALFLPLTNDDSFQSDNMNGEFVPVRCLMTYEKLTPRLGWIDFFSHKYLVCGKLVENTD